MHHCCNSPPARPDTARAIGGYAWEKARCIWYETLLDPQLRPTANFLRFASLTLVHADKLYGAGSPEWQAVKQAWNEVGLAVT
jgi:Zn-dependent metalloprotease